MLGNVRFKQDAYRDTHDDDDDDSDDDYDYDQDTEEDAAASSSSSSEEEEDSPFHPRPPTVVTLSPESAASSPFPPGCPVIYRPPNLHERQTLDVVEIGTVQSVAINISPGSSRELLHVIRVSTSGKSSSTSTPDDGIATTLTRTVGETKLRYAPHCPVLLRNNGMISHREARGDDMLDATILYGDPTTTTTAASRVEYSVLATLPNDDDGNGGGGDGGNGGGSGSGGPVRHAVMHGVSADRIKFDNRRRSSSVETPPGGASSTCFALERCSAQQASAVDVPEASVEARLKSYNDPVKNGQGKPDVSPSSSRTYSYGEPSTKKIRWTPPPSPAGSELSQSGREKTMPRPTSCIIPRHDRSTVVRLTPPARLGSQSGREKTMPRQRDRNNNKAVRFRGKCDFIHCEQNCETRPQSSHPRVNQSHATATSAMKSSTRYAAAPVPKKRFFDLTECESGGDDSQRGDRCNETFAERISIPDWLVARKVIGFVFREISELRSKLDCQISVRYPRRGGDKRFVHNDSTCIIISGKRRKSVSQAKQCIENSIIDFVGDDRSMGRLLYDFAKSDNDGQSANVKHGAVLRKSPLDATRQVWMSLIEVPSDEQGEHHCRFLLGPKGRIVNEVSEKFGCSMNIHGLPGDALLCDPYVLLTADTKGSVDKAVVWLLNIMHEHMDRCYCSWNFQP